MAVMSELWRGSSTNERTSHRHTGTHTHTHTHTSASRRLKPAVLLLECVTLRVAPQNKQLSQHCYGNAIVLKVVEWIIRILRFELQRSLGLAVGSFFTALSQSSLGLALQSCCVRLARVAIS